MNIVDALIEFADNNRKSTHIEIFTDSVRVTIKGDTSEIINKLMK